MANSEVDICNIALRKLREQPIASLTEDSEPAKICNTVYSDLLDFYLARHPHNFAMTRQLLGQKAEVPAFQYDFTYALPTDPYCLRAFQLYNGESLHNHGWEVSGRNLLTSFDNNVFLIYIARVSDTRSFSPTFVEALSSRLAAIIAYALSRDKAFVDDLLKVAKDDWKIHRHTDGSEGFPYEQDAGPFVSARFDGSLDGLRFSN